MGWWDAGEGMVGGDEPLDVYGEALDALATRCRKAVKRPPFLAEIVEAFDATAPREPSPTFDALVRTLDGDAPLVSRRPPPLTTGELLALPYADGESVTLLVLYGSERKKGEGPGYGPCLVALDLDPREAASDLDRVRTARWLTRPFHPGSVLAAERVGQVELAPDAAFLPCFVWYSLPGSSSRSALAAPGLARRVYDYFGADVTGTPGVDARVVENSVGGAAFVVVSVRAALGRNRELPWSRHRLPPDAPRTPLAALPPLRAPTKAKPKKPARPKPADDALRAELARTVHDATEACRRAWRDAMSREPKREELASALATVLSASAHTLVADPTRLEALDRPRHTRRNPSDAAPRYRFDRRGMDVVGVEAAGASWSAFPFREEGALVLETLGAPPDALTHVPAILRCWRDARSLPHEPEPVIVRPMDWGGPMRTVA